MAFLLAGMAALEAFSALQTASSFRCVLGKVFWLGNGNRSLSAEDR